jgi:hypothetical protein
VPYEKFSIPFMSIVSISLRDNKYSTTSLQDTKDKTTAKQQINASIFFIIILLQTLVSKGACLIYIIHYPVRRCQVVAWNKDASSGVFQTPPSPAGEG